MATSVVDVLRWHRNRLRRDRGRHGRRQPFGDQNLFRGTLPDILVLMRLPLSLGNSLQLRFRWSRKSVTQGADAAFRLLRLVSLVNVSSCSRRPIPRCGIRREIRAISFASEESEALH